MAEKRALTKFLRCVEWSDVQEAKQAIQLMDKWETIDVCDALELQSPLFQSEEVRAFAVSVLERADDEELQCYLLQLICSMSYTFTTRKHRYSDGHSDGHSNPQNFPRNFRGNSEEAQILGFLGIYRRNSEETLIRRYIPRKFRGEMCSSQNFEEIPTNK
ncbi:hypothetical protein F2Q69_00031453 [Brassica cretica]|uniref:PIK helical domain-containing protein n=1 Tax=Brassica cretica TaxID=69181 RepID=A0A8S9RZV5_BRACR|nr:hypothetical protein F2Q69_00031453 [Brassica cretica]